MDSEVSGGSTMHGTESTCIPHEVLHQILGELRDFRREFNERNAAENGATLAWPPAPAFQMGNKYVQANSNHSLSSIPPQAPGKFPGNAPVVGTASEAYPDLHQHFLDLEKAKLASYYNGEMKKLSDQIEAKELWEASLQKNVELTMQLTEQKAKVLTLQRSITRKGRNDSPVFDDDIGDKFEQLGDGILQMVNTHIVRPTEEQPSHDASPNSQELYARMTLALALYDKLFSPKAMLFGYEDHLFEKSPFRKFEETLRESDFDESAIKEWRVTTVKACKLLNRDLGPYALAISEQIWKENVHPYRQIMSQQSDARKDLYDLCQKAAELAIFFRSSSTEYEWEQDMSRLKSLEVILNDHQIVGTEGPQPDGESKFEIAHIVFGGVVRGDKATGSLEYGRTRLSRSLVVIGHPKQRF